MSVVLNVISGVEDNGNDAVVPLARSTFNVVSAPVCANHEIAMHNKINSLDFIKIIFFTNLGR